MALALRSTPIESSCYQDYPRWQALLLQQSITAQAGSGLWQRVRRSQGTWHKKIDFAEAGERPTLFGSLPFFRTRIHKVVWARPLARGQRVAADRMLVRCNARRAHFIKCR